MDQAFQIRQGSADRSPPVYAGHFALDIAADEIATLV